MGLLDYMEGAKNKLAGLLGEMPISRMVHQGIQPPTVNGLRDALYAMPKPFDANDQTANELAMALWNPAGLLGKIVYHGSPHKFTKFDASKIGTGEGAQAYGHGIYAAENPLVAKDYQSLGRARDEMQIGGLPYDDFLDSSRKTVPTVTRDRALFSKAATRAKSLEELDSNLMVVKAENPSYDFSTIDALTKEAKTRGIKFSNSGHLYKADLPDEWIPKMLDWDKPISEKMRRQISKPMIEKFGSGASGGQGLNQWKQVVWEFKNAGSKRPEVDAANFLREQGLTGIRYLDGGSRGAGQGSYNYVVFPGLEDQVKILERNGKGLLDY